MTYDGKRRVILSNNLWSGTLRGPYKAIKDGNIESIGTYEVSFSLVHVDIITQWIGFIKKIRILD